MAEKQRFVGKMSKKRQEFDNSKIDVENNLHKIRNLITENKDDIISLNIGGTHKITTLRKTLCKYENSGLCALFKSKEILLPNHKGSYFIDRDGNMFSNILYFLRNDKLPYFSSSDEELLFQEELDFWGIKSENAGKYIF